MIPIGPIGFEALAEIGAQWLSWAWLSVPVVLLSFVALVVRYRMALVAARRFDRNGNGQWLDGRRSTRGKLTTGPAGAAELGVLLAQFERRKKGSDPSPFTLSGDVVITLDGGAIVRIPGGTPLKIELGADRAASRRLTQAHRADGMQTVQLVAKEGARVWLVAHTESAVDDGPLRTGANVELSNRADVSLHFVKPRADETSFGGAYALTVLSIGTSVLLATTEAGFSVFAIFEAIFGLLAVRSILGSRKTRAALVADSTSAANRP